MLSAQSKIVGNSEVKPLILFLGKNYLKLSKMTFIVKIIKMNGKYLKLKFSNEKYFVQWDLITQFRRVTLKLRPIFVLFLL